MASKPNKAERMMAKFLVTMQSWTWFGLMLEFSKKLLCCPPDQREQLMRTALEAVRNFEQVDIE